MEWQPIETAPKDGTQFLGYDPDHGEAKIYVLKYFERNDFDENFRVIGIIKCFEEASGEGWFTWNPTHWMPLPDPPKE